jgi:hypothetical protein
MKENTHFYRQQKGLGHERNKFSWVSTRWRASYDLKTLIKSKGVVPIMFNKPSLLTSLYFGHRWQSTCNLSSQPKHTVCTLIQMDTLSCKNFETKHLVTLQWPLLKKFLTAKSKKSTSCRSCRKRLQEVAVKKVKDIGKPEGGALWSKPRHRIHDCTYEIHTDWLSKVHRQWTNAPAKSYWRI